MPNISELTSIMGCETSCLPSSCLGLLLGAKYRATSIWNSVNKRMKRRLATWWRSLHIVEGILVTLCIYTYTIYIQYMVYHI